MPATPPLQPPQPFPRGVQTSEFWVAIVSAIAGLLGQAAGFVPEPWGTILAAVSTAAYAISRGLSKRG